MDLMEPKLRGGRRTGKLSGLLATALVTALMTGCNVPEAYVWNLKQVHDSDGSPKRYGILHSPIQQLFSEAFDATEFGAPSFAEEKPTTIDDPLSVCLTNLRDLFNADMADPQTAARMVEMLTWLGGDCTYHLSRECCALVLGDVGRRYGVTGPKALPEDAEIATVKEVREIYLQLATDVVPVLAGNAELTASLAEHCADADHLVLDRAAGQRLVAATASLLKRGGFDRTGLEPLIELHRATARHCLELVLGDLLADPEPLVRAAAIRSWIELSEGREEAGYLAAFRDTDPLPVLEAVRALARHGIPEVKGDGAVVDTAESRERDWCKRLVTLLSAVPDGMLTVGTCRAMARITGRPENLRPEHWISWWLDVEAERELEPAQP